MTYISIHEASTKWDLSERRLTYLCRNGKITGIKKVGGSWLIPSDAVKPLDGRTKEAQGVPFSLEEKEESDSSLSSLGGQERVKLEFKKKYKRDPFATAFTPYRICPLGAHSDFSLGRITGFAIDKGVHIAYGPKMNGIVEISSLQFSKRAQWHVGSTPETKQGDWADHLRGATIALNKRYPLRVGLSAVFNGELPIGGLSSSASVIITYLNALAHLNNITLTDEELITIAKEAENNYVGVACGKLDQSCEVYCKKDSLLFMDFLDDSKEIIPIGKNKQMKPFEIIIFFSGLERSLATSKYNMRVDEVRSAAYALKAFAGLEYGKFNETNLRDVPKEIYERYKDKLPTPWEKRARHWYEEQERVLKGVEAFKNGDIETFGRLVFESGYSSIHNYETGSDELKKIYEIMTHTKGIYGGRFSGAGFKGCLMALINPDYEEEILAQVENEYLAAFPHLRGKYAAFICHTADGVHLNR